MTATDTHTSGPDTRRVVRHRKWWGLGFMVPPLTVFTFFAVAEGIGREPGWWGHVIQLAAAGALTAGAWIRPRVGGPLLIAAGAALTAVMLVRADAGAANLPAVAIVFMPLIAAGVSFTLAGFASGR